MHEGFEHDKLICVKPEFSKNALIKMDQYKKLYLESIQNPDKFWAEQAERLHWFKKWDRVKNTQYTKPVSVRWFEGGELNVSYNCVDRHAQTRGDKVAIIWEPDNPETPARKITYKELLSEVSRFANVLKRMGVKKGDRVSIYMPMIPETAFAMLACTRIGAIHSVIFGGFSPDSIADRVNDSTCEWVITADEGYRGGKTIALKANVDAALPKTSTVKRCWS